MTSVHFTQRRHLVARWLLSVMMVCAVTMFWGTINANAVGGISAKDCYTCTILDVDGSTDEARDLASWDDIKSIATDTSQEEVNAYNTTQYRNYKAACNIYSTFETQAGYEKATAKLQAIVRYNAVTDELIPVNASTKGQQDLSRAVDSFNSHVGTVTANNTINGVFDTGSFNPSAGLAAPWLDTFYTVVNTVFYVVSNATIWWFLAQTSFDMLYILCEPLRPIIGPAGSGGIASGSGFGSQNAGWKGYANKAISFLHLCSQDAAAACGGSGGGGFGSQNASSKNPFFIYLQKRAPVVVFLGAYLVLVSAGWWPRIIARVAGLVARFLGMFF